MTASEEQPKKLCHEQRQAFVDCMFLHSPCVQAGKKPFKACLEEEQTRPEGLHPDCAKLLREFHICRAQIVRNKLNTAACNMFRLTRGQDYEDFDS
jgi:hypothetical protein